MKLERYEFVMFGMKAANSPMALHDEPIGLKKNKRQYRHVRQ